LRRKEEEHKQGIAKIQKERVQSRFSMMIWKTSGEKIKQLIFMAWKEDVAVIRWNKEWQKEQETWKQQWEAHQDLLKGNERSRAVAMCLQMSDIGEAEKRTLLLQVYWSAWREKWQERRRENSLEAGQRVLEDDLNKATQREKVLEAGHRVLEDDLQRLVAEKEAWEVEAAELENLRKAARDLLAENKILRASVKKVPVKKVPIEEIVASLPKVAVEDCKATECGVCS